MNVAKNTLSYPMEVMMRTKKAGLNEDGNVPVPVLRAKRFKRIKRVRPNTGIHGIRMLGFAPQPTGD